MIKILAAFIHEVEGRACKFLMDHDTPIPIAKEMAFAFLKYLGQIEDASKAAIAAKEQESKVEPIPEEVEDE